MSLQRRLGVALPTSEAAGASCSKLGLSWLVNGLPAMQSGRWLSLLV